MLSDKRLVDISRSDKSPQDKRMSDNSMPDIWKALKIYGFCSYVVKNHVKHRKLLSTQNKEMVFWTYLTIIISPFWGQFWPFWLLQPLKSLLSWSWSQDRLRLRLRKLSLHQIPSSWRTKKSPKTYRKKACCWRLPMKSASESRRRFLL